MLKRLETHELSRIIPSYFQTKSTMLYSEETTQVTEVAYQFIESKFNWEIKDPAELSNYIQSQTVKIPIVDAEW